MAVARVVSFEGVPSDRVEGMQQEMDQGPPEGFPPAEVIVLHDPDAEASTVIVIFENEEDYAKGDEVLSAMSADDTPGRRTSVKKHNVAARVKG